MGVQGIDQTIFPEVLEKPKCSITRDHSEIPISHCYLYNY